MENYLDGFVLPIPKNHLEQYQQVAQKVAAIWKEHGALSYFEFVGDDLQFEGLRSFPETINAKENEVIIFGWVVFESRKTRDEANERVAADPRMTDLIAPLTSPEKIIFNAERMVYGGFKPLVHSI
ncbi:MAG: DUF1428 domain-containing protein [Bacteroidota bacterium]